MFIKSNPYEPNQNGLAEKANPTLVDLARTMLIDSKLQKSLWAEAVNFATQILNMTTINKVAGKTAHELVYDQKPYYGICTLLVRPVCSWIRIRVGRNSTRKA